MKPGHIHCKVRDLPAAARWFEKIFKVKPVHNNERMVWLSFGGFGLILDSAPDSVPDAGPGAASVESVFTLAFDSDDCDADYKILTSRGAETITPPKDYPWGARAAYLKGPGGLTIELEQVLKGE